MDERTARSLTAKAAAETREGVASIAARLDRIESLLAELLLLSTGKATGPNPTNPTRPRG